jgi:hypothetical protein
MVKVFCHDVEFRLILKCIRQDLCHILTAGDGDKVCTDRKANQSLSGTIGQSIQNSILNRVFQRFVLAFNISPIFDTILKITHLGNFVWMESARYAQK